jgi:hypothetical protein
MKLYCTSKNSALEGCCACGRIVKEILRHRLSLAGGWPEVLSTAPIVQILNKWVLPVAEFIDPDWGG